MTNSILNFVVTLLLGIALLLFLPWWGVMLAGFAAGLIVPRKGGAAFIAPFLAIAFVWIFYAWYLSSSNDFILASRMANLLPLGGSTALLILFTGAVGGTAAGLGGVFGSSLRGLFSSGARSLPYYRRRKFGR